MNQLLFFIRERLYILLGGAQFVIPPYLQSVNFIDTKV